MVHCVEYWDSDRRLCGRQLSITKSVAVLRRWIKGTRASTQEPDLRRVKFEKKVLQKFLKNCGVLFHM